MRAPQRPHRAATSAEQRPQLNIRVKRQQFEEDDQQSGSGRRRSGRWRNDAANTVDNFQSVREINSRQVYQPPGYPEIGTPSMTSSPTEAYLRSVATVGPPMERIYDPSVQEISPINRGSVTNETRMLAEGILDAPGGRRDIFQGDNITRQQRQVSFDMPQGEGKSRREKKEAALSPLKRFDRDATAELKKRRQTATERGIAVLQETRGYEYSRPSAVRQSSLSMAAKSSMSGREVAWLLRDEPDTDLIDAVEQLVMAEEAVVYDGAVRAAEEAAAKAPPELAEEAAAAGARSYRAEITHSVQEILAGEKPIEIIGYVGITRPREK